MPLTTTVDKVMTVRTDLNSPSILVDATWVPRLMLNDSISNAAERAEAVRLIGIIARGWELAIKDGGDADKTLLCAEPTLGEGALFKAIASNRQSMIPLPLQVENFNSMAFQEQINALSMKFRPAAFSVPIAMEADRLRSEAERRSPIDVYESVHKGVKEIGIDIIWDLRRAEHGAVSFEADVIQIIHTMQDASLEPRGWIVDLPERSETMAILTSMAHIDGREDVSIAFDPSGYETLNETSVMRSQEENAKIASDIARTPGNTQILFGAKALLLPLRGLQENLLNGDEAIAEIASRIARTAQIFNDATISS